MADGTKRFWHADFANVLKLSALFGCLPLRYLAPFFFWSCAAWPSLQGKYEFRKRIWVLVIGFSRAGFFWPSRADGHPARM